MMATYNYFKEVRKDAMQVILDNYSLEELHSDNIEEKLYDELVNNDSVTGNASGSYTFSRYQAEEYICHNFDALLNASNDFGIDIGYAIREGAEYCDVLIRCYILKAVIYDILLELLNK